jgi:hypothetical protein
MALPSQADAIWPWPWPVTNIDNIKEERELHLFLTLSFGPRQGTLAFMAL